MGSGGGGTGGYNGRNEVVVGRRMWTETNFVGVLKEFPRETTGSHFKKTEEFLDLVEYGPFLVPKRIVFENWDKRVFTYRVEKVQFRNDPDDQWFIEQRNRFHYSPDEEKKFLAESIGATNRLSDGGSIHP